MAFKIDFVRSPKRLDSSLKGVSGNLKSSIYYKRALAAARSWFLKASPDAGKVWGVC